MSGNPTTVIGRPFVDVFATGTGASSSFRRRTGTRRGSPRYGRRSTRTAWKLNMLRRGPSMIGEEMHWIFGVRYFGLEESLTVETLSRDGRH